MIPKEEDYNEVDYELIIKKKSGDNLAESKFNEYTKKIEEIMSNDEFLVIVKKLDNDDYEIEY